MNRVDMQLRRPLRGVDPAVPGFRVGCAGWSIPSRFATGFPAGSSHLERYAAALPAVEINSSFYRPHRVSTYARWAEAVPAGFRFSVKLPRTITHERRLVAAEALLDGFLGEVAGLGRRLGCLLAQLPPSLDYRPEVLEHFLDALRARHEGPLVIEPRHPSWFEGAASVHLAARRVARAGADPSPGPGGDRPAGDRGLSYLRLHGSPRTYYSEYGTAALRRFAGRLRAALEWSGEAWCIFDNTALGAATGNALELLSMLAAEVPADAAACAPAATRPMETSTASVGADPEVWHQQDAGQRDQHRAGEVQQQAGAQHVGHAHASRAEHHRIR
jgi:uncharacterized protein YecE (DUF72 family)